MLFVWENVPSCVLSTWRTDTIDQTQLAARDVSFEDRPFPRSVGLEGGHARLIKARHRVNKRQVDAVISDHYHRNISSKEDLWCSTTRYDEF